MNGARGGEERGRGVPLTEEERVRRHFEQYRTEELPPRGTGLSGLNSLKVLQSLGNPEYQISNSDIIGLVLGSAIGWIVAKKWPNMVVKYVGVIVGAELGILVARMVSSRTTIVGGK